jgi:hypothetical protein
MQTPLPRPGDKDGLGKLQAPGRLPLVPVIKIQFLVLAVACPAALLSAIVYVFKLQGLYQPAA